MTSNSKADWERSIIVLTTTVVITVIVGCLYWSRDIVIPIALAVFLTFILSPIVNALSRFGLPRVVSVLVVLAGVGVGIAGIGMLLTMQSTSLIQELPKHRDTIRERIHTIRSSFSSESTKQIQSLVDEVTREISGTPKTTVEKGTASDPDVIAAQEHPPVGGRSTHLNGSEPSPQPVVVSSASGSGEMFWPAIFSSTANALGTLALTLILVAFMLVNREDLRDRFLRLMGDHRLATATMAMDDAGRRISRFLLMQFLINSVYGVVLGIGLWLIGVPYALLWGVFAGILRYIPYLGAWLAAIFPIAFSLATTHEWGQPLMTIGLIIVLELLTNNVFEPLLYGSSMGISQVALIVSAAFWTFLWGPVGLVLSNPLTVILLILGQRVEQFRVLHILLGEDTPLAAHIRFFQRLIAGDQDEATTALAKVLDETDRVTAADSVIMPALNMLVESKRGTEINNDDVKRVNLSVMEIVDDVFEEKAEEHSHENARPLSERPKLLVVPIDSVADGAAQYVLVRLLESTQWNVLSPPHDMLVSEVIDWMAREEPAAICLVGMDAGSRAHTRYLCKRLAARHVTEHLLISRLGDSLSPSAKESFLRLNANVVVCTLKDTLRTLGSWFPIASQQERTRERDSVGVA